MSRSSAPHAASPPAADRWFHTACRRPAPCAARSRRPPAARPTGRATTCQVVRKRLGSSHMLTILCRSASVVLFRLRRGGSLLDECPPVALRLVLSFRFAASPPQASTGGAPESPGQNANSDGTQLGPPRPAFPMPPGRLRHVAEPADLQCRTVILFFAAR